MGEYRQRSVASESPVAHRVERAGDDNRIIRHRIDRAAVVIRNLVKYELLAETRVEADGLDTARRIARVDELHITETVAQHLKRTVLRLVFLGLRCIVLVVAEDKHAVVDVPAVRRKSVRKLDVIVGRHSRSRIKALLPRIARLDHIDPVGRADPGFDRLGRSARLALVLGRVAYENLRAILVVRVAPRVEILVIGADYRHRLRLFVDLEKEITRNAVDRKGRILGRRGLGKLVGDGELRPVFSDLEVIRRQIALRSSAHLLVHELKAVFNTVIVLVERLIKTAPHPLADEFHRN